jgi:hypothetical protein
VDPKLQGKKTPYACVRQPEEKVKERGLEMREFGAWVAQFSEIAVTSSHHYRR